MIPLLCAAMAAAAALAAFLSRPWQRAACLCAGAGMAAAAGVALVLPVDAPLLLGEASLGDSPGVRAWIAVCGGILGIALLVNALLTPDRETAIVAPVVLAALSIAAALDTPSVALPAAAAVGLLVLGGARRSWPAGMRQAALVPALASAAVVVGASVGRLVPEVPPLPTVAFAAPVLGILAIALRIGVVPLHVAPLRVARGSPLPLVAVGAAWAPAILVTLVAAWAGTDPRVAAALATPELAGSLAVVGAVTVSLAVLAMFIQEDLGALLCVHAIADGALCLLALGVDPIPFPELVTWLVVSAAARTALAVWGMVAVERMGSRSIGQLRGWVRVAPLLLPTLVGAAAAGIGWPGSPTFEARRSIVEAALPGPAGLIVAIASAAVAVGYLRLLVVGVLAPDDGVRAPIGWAQRAGRWLGASAAAGAVLIPLALTSGLGGLREIAQTWQPFVER